MTARIQRARSRRRCRWRPAAWSGRWPPRDTVSPRRAERWFGESRAPHPLRHLSRARRSLVVCGTARAFSSDGRALRSHRRGRGIETPIAHSPVEGRVESVEGIFRDRDGYQSRLDLQARADSTFRELGVISLPRFPWTRVASPTRNRRRITYDPAVTSLGDHIVSRSPWLQQLDADSSPRPLDRNCSTDVAIVGAGIAGVATAFFTLRDTSCDVLLIERNRVGRGATGHNAGQLASYFERPLCDLVDAYGFDAAIEAQRAFDGADDLLDEMMTQAGVTARVERVVGHMGMFSLNHLLVHLRNNLLRQQGGLRVDSCVISQDAEFVGDIPAEFEALYSVVPQAHVREMLSTTDDRYRAVLSSPRVCATSALIVQQVLSFLETQYAGRFTYVDHTPVTRIVLGDDCATLNALGHQDAAANGVL